MTKIAFAGIGLAFGALLALAAPSFAATAEVEKPPRESWTFAGPFGYFDNAQLQRGFKVYREVCSACHSMKKLSFRNLSQPGGPEFTEDQVKALAAEYKVQDGPNDSGDMFERPARPSDRFPSPFPNDQAARAANGGALPPDMSVLAKARTYHVGFPGFIFDMFTQYQENGPDYIHALVAEGYVDAPADFKLADGANYNKFMPGNQIAMPMPISNDQVEYTDGTPQTVDQYTRDVTTFLMWAAEPHLEERKEMGLKVMIFLIIFAGLLYFTKKKVWKAAGAH